MADARARRSSLIVRKDICCQSCRSPPFRGVTEVGDPKSRFQTPFVNWSSSSSFCWNLSAIVWQASASESKLPETSREGWSRKGREHLFLDRQVILHSYACHRGSKSNICIIRWKLRVRKAGRWGLESSHPSWAVSLYQFLLDTWTDLCYLILSAVDAGFYQHRWYQHQSIAGLQPSFLDAQLCPSFQVGPTALLKVCNETPVCGFYGRHFDSCKSQWRRATGGRAQLIKTVTLQSLSSVWNAAFSAADCFKPTKCTRRI